MELITTIIQSNTYAPVTIGGLTAIVAIFIKIVFSYLSSLGKVSIFASIAGLYRGNVIEIDAGEDEKVKSGSIFTVYKKLQIREISDGRWGSNKGRYYYKPVAQLKVISTTRDNALCKYRPIRGYSANPSVGDTAYYCNKFESGKVIPYPG